MIFNKFVFFITIITLDYCYGWCHITRSNPTDVGLIVKNTYKINNDIWLKPEPSFKSLAVSLYLRTIIITRGNFTALKWNVITTSVIYSPTINECAIATTVNDEKQFVIVTRCASGLGLMHQDSVMMVQVTGGAEISVSCDPEAYDSIIDYDKNGYTNTDTPVNTDTVTPVSFEETMNPIQTPQSDTATVTIMALFIIGLIIAMIYLKNDEVAEWVEGEGWDDGDCKVSATIIEYILDKHLDKLAESNSKKLREQMNSQIAGNSNNDPMLTNSVEQQPECSHKPPLEKNTQRRVTFAQNTNLGKTTFERSSDLPKAAFDQKRRISNVTSEERMKSKIPPFTSRGDGSTRENCIVEEGRENVFATPSTSRGTKRRIGELIREEHNRIGKVDRSAQYHVQNNSSVDADTRIVRRRILHSTEKNGDIRKMMANHATKISSTPIRAPNHTSAINLECEEELPPTPHIDTPRPQKESVDVSLEAIQGSCTQLTETSCEANVAVETTQHDMNDASHLSDEAPNHELPQESAEASDNTVDLTELESFIEDCQEIDSTV